MNPVIFQIGPFSLHWYGVFIVGGAVLAAWVAGRTAARAGYNPDHVWNMLAWALVVGIIGARLYHVFSTPANGIGFNYYMQHPDQIFNFWNGGFRGLGIYGGLVGGILAIAVYARVQKLDLMMWLDFIAPNVLLAQAIGRMGNWVNQELYGPSTDLPWAFHINPNFPCQDPANRPLTVQPCGTGAQQPFSQESLDWYANNGFHPTFFYEALWNLVGFGLVMVFGRKLYPKLRDGDIFLFYLIWYPLGRIIVEMFRPDAWISGLPGLATAQLISLAMIVVGVVGLIVRHRNWQPTPAGAAGMAGNVAAADDESAA